ncbi:UDP-N-acetylmuramoyl-tripeptide--D-alanyl-D-alanine ligase [Dinoroseobacter sp. S124A]|uniref:UDP-N-acetylmuramoyl-tripeptide--D-alanyl-D- alanine ligase n=1 Tax=Dinoroseobacter sp. S124A TaxID=3415128 RepID=UPI003C7A4116
MTAPLWTAAEAAAATGGTAHGDWTVSGVSIDTREMAQGDLFVALRAARDGHDFVAAALEAGAGAALVSRIPDGVPSDAPLLLVADVQAALEDLGRVARSRTRARVVAITGSVGKTSAKEMLRAALSSQGRVHAAVRSFNNHWGVPLTLARMPVETDYAVIEIGMNHPGEIAPLARMARPNAALITTIAAAHLEALGSLEGIADEKATIFEGLTDSGLAMIPGDLAQTPILRAAAEAAGARIESFGAGTGNSHILQDPQVAGDCAVARAQLAGMPLALKIATPGTHFLETALGVLAIAAGIGADPAEALLGLAQWAPPAGRGTREALQLDPAIETLTADLIDDAFNANPTSMGAALTMLAASQPAHDIGRIAKGRRIAILGDMLELGPEERAEHAALADHEAMERVDLVHCVGPRMRALYDVLPASRQGNWVETAPELAARAHTLIDAGDVVLVKGSKGSRVSLVVDALRKLGHPTSRHENEGSP